MHPALENLGYYALYREFTKTEELCVSILEDMELIPKKNNAPACPECSGCMQAADQEIAWLWKCSKDTCSGYVNPLQNTFFEDFQLPLRAVVWIILYGFVRKQAIHNAFLDCVRSPIFDLRTPSPPDFNFEPVKHIYNKCKRVCEIIMSQKHERMIGPYISTLYLMYLKRTLNAPKLNFGEKAYAFLMDVKTVYPGYGKTGLNYKHLSSSLPTAGGV